MSSRFTINYAKDKSYIELKNMLAQLDIEKRTEGIKKWIVYTKEQMESPNRIKFKL